VLRLTPGTACSNFSAALKETLPHLPQEKAVAVVCAGASCLPPTSDPEQLVALLERGAARVSTGT